MKSELATLWTRVISHSKTERLLAIGLFALLTALGAGVRIPLPGSPVPITLQTLAVLGAGLYLGAAAGAGSQILYLLAGALGLAWFAGGTKQLFLALPTAGYLLAFPLAAALAARAASGSLASRLWWLSAAAAAVLVAGGSWLAIFGGLSWRGALVVGILPFIPGEVIKIAVAAGWSWCCRRPQ